MEKELIDSISLTNIDGLIIEALGAGNIPPSIVPGLTNLINNGLTVLFVSRCYKGIVQPTYQYKGGGGRTLLDKGVIFANHLNGQKARLKLMLLLEKGASNDDIILAFKD